MWHKKTLIKVIMMLMDCVFMVVVVMVSGDGVGSRSRGESYGDGYAI